MGLGDQASGRRFGGASVLNIDAPPRRRAHLLVAFKALGLAPRTGRRRREGPGLPAFSMSEISVHELLETVGDFDGAGGASLGLLAWELSVEPARAVRAWGQAQAEGLIEAAGVDRASGEQLWRLTARGWARLRGNDQDR